VPITVMQYIADLFRAEAGRLRAEVDPGMRLSGAVTHQDRLAASFDRMAAKVGQTISMKGVDDAAAA
jgi:hypothetical protein